MPRRQPSSEEKEAILKRQKHLCAHCGRPLSGATRVEFDHRQNGLPRWYFADSASDADIDNPAHLQALHAKCHRKRTSKDLGRIAKTKRLRGDTGQKARRRRATTRKIPSRPFPTWS